MASFEVKRRDAKTGNKRERSVPKLSPAEAQSGIWARSAVGRLHHFFVDGSSVCGRQLPPQVTADATRKLCPECYTAVNRAAEHGALAG